jgi:SAM-dependent methyltransferase
MSGTGDAATWDRLSDVYASDLALTPPERSLLARLRGSWQDLDMLDLGVGAGRTSYTFSALARRYVGVDFSPRMIEHARRLVPEDDRSSFVVQDVRDLSRWHGDGFGVVLFSFNGIDAVDPADRAQVLSEVRKVISDEGVFAFASHSLHALPFDLGLRRPSLRAPLSTTYRNIRRAAGLARANRKLDLDQAWERGWTLVRDDAHDFSLVLCYVSPAHQVAQLAELGFPECEVLNMSGHEVDADRPGRDPHLFYIARPRRASAP